ncbi:MAG: Gfo/Idh/MocA family oxidoreductase [Lachnospiraceae bacterium]|nr:Gfo/Idh/MocA family oxidoreductase [Lachnospiraceae bacterium]
MERVGLGIVGGGAIARRILAHLDQEDVKDKVFLAAICDPAPGRAQEIAETFHIARWYLSLEEMLADSEVDAVTLCTPIGLHFQQGIQAIEAGKHVHFNKTMAVTTKEVDMLVEAAQKKGVKLAASPGNMLWPFNQRKRKYILEGKLGKVVWASGCSGNSATYHLNEGERRNTGNASHNVNPAWYFQKNGGGPLYDSTIYAIHSITGVLGPAKSVLAVSKKMRESFIFNGIEINNEMDDFIVMILEFEGGAHGIIYAIPTEEPEALGGQFGVFYGLDGYIDRVGLNGEMNLKYEGDRMPHHFGEHGKLWECHVYEDVMQLVSWILEDGEEPLCSVSHAKHAIEIIEACYESIRIGTAVPLKTTFTPLTLEEINRNLEKFGGKGPGTRVPQFGGDYEV